MSKSFCDSMMASEEAHMRMLCIFCFQAFQINLENHLLLSSCAVIDSNIWETVFEANLLYFIAIRNNFYVKKCKINLEFFSNWLDGQFGDIHWEWCAQQEHNWMGDIFRTQLWSFSDAVAFRLCDISKSTITISKVCCSHNFGMNSTRRQTLS